MQNRPPPYRLTNHAQDQLKERDISIALLELLFTGTQMKIRYDAEVDALYIDLSAAKVAETDEVAPGVYFDYDENGVVIGIEMLDASERVGDLTSVQYDVTPKKSA